MTDYTAERSYWMQEAAELRRMLATGKLSQEATDAYRRALKVAEEREGNAILASLIF